MRIIFGVLQLIAINLSLCNVALSAQPTCKSVVGEWKNQLGSTLNVVSADAKTGKISGNYVSPSGTSGTSYDMSGWINSSATGGAKSNVPVIAFSVQWGSYGSITSWTGYCEDKQGTPTITTIWNLVRANSDFIWDHILTSSDVFIPK